MQSMTVENQSVVENQSENQSQIWASLLVCNSYILLKSFIEYSISFGVFLQKQIDM
jgi:hypothetical protein